MQKPYNWRTDYDWTDPNDEPVDETIIDETELMLPKDARGLDSLREGENTRVATSGPSHRISELIRRYNDGTITEEEKIELEMLIEMTPTMAQGGRIGYAWRGKVNLGDKFSLKERLNPRDPQNELIAEHMQIGKLPANITRRILALNKGGKSYEDIAQLTGVEIEDINSILNVANKPDIIDPVDKSGKVDYDLWDDIVTENISIRDRPEHLDYKMRGQKMLADGGRIGYAFGPDDPGIVEDDLSTIEFMQDQGVPYGEQASGIDPSIRIEEVVKEFIKRKGRRPRSIEEIKEFYIQEMAGGSGGPQRVAYNPGDYDPMIVDEYEKYKGSQEEQGAPVITIDEFLMQQRAGVRAGGLPGILGV